MKVLIVTSGNPRSGEFDFTRDRAFVADQMRALEQMGVEFEIFLVDKKGRKGYQQKRKELSKYLKTSSVDLIHAHYGLSAAVVPFFCSIPKVVTYHGSDINLPKIRAISVIAGLGYDARVFVSEMLLNKTPLRLLSNNHVIPCGVDLDIFHPLPKEDARKQLGLEPEKKYILFASSFDNPVKNYPLAREAVELLARQGENVELLELKGHSREEVNLLLNAVDALVMTSHNEGSPQIIKEAMAAGTPVVSVPVGETPALLNGSNGHWIVQPEAESVCDGLARALAFQSKTNGRQTIAALSNETIAKRILAVYEQASGQRVGQQAG